MGSNGTLISRRADFLVIAELLPTALVVPHVNRPR